MLEIAPEALEWMCVPKAVDSLRIAVATVVVGNFQTRPTNPLLWIQTNFDVATVVCCPATAVTEVAQCDLPNHAFLVKVFVQVLAAADIADQATIVAAA